MAGGRVSARQVAGDGPARLSEAGVRFVEICHPGWDHHNNLHKGLIDRCGSVDQPTAALLTDLERRGLLSTKPSCSSEASSVGCRRAQGQDGRDHNITGYPMFLTGAGVKKGITYGRNRRVRHSGGGGPDAHHRPCTPTLLGVLMGLDHEKEVDVQVHAVVRDFRLTDVKGSVVKEIFA